MSLHALSFPPYGADQCVEGLRQGGSVAEAAKVLPLCECVECSHNRDRRLDVQQITAFSDESGQDIPASSQVSILPCGDEYCRNRPQFSS